MDEVGVGDKDRVDDELVKFHFQFSEEVLFRLTYTMTADIEQFALTYHGKLTWWDDPIKRVRHIQGKKPRRVVTVLQAVAMGEDVAKVMELTEP